MNLTKKEIGELFYHAMIKFPNGSENSPIIIEVGGATLQAIFFPYEDNIVSFGLFFPLKKYSRKTILIYRDGYFSEDKIGVIPSYDITKSEPVFDDIEDAEILFMIWEELKK